MVLIPYFILAAVRAADRVELLAVRCAMAQPLADRNHMRNNGLRYRLFIWDAQLTAGICTSSAPVVHLHHFAGRGAKQVRRAGRPWRKRTRFTPNQKRRNLVALMVMILAIFPFLADFWCCGDCRVQLGYPLPMKSQQLALAPRKGGPLANLLWEKTP